MFSRISVSGGFNLLMNLIGDSPVHQRRLESAEFTRGCSDVDWLVKSTLRLNCLIFAT
jgi:hypothetical protein